MTAPAAAPRPGLAHRRLALAVSYADVVLDGVAGQMLSRPTPCHAWNLRMLLEHSAESLATFREGVTSRTVAASPAEVRAPASDAAGLVSVLRDSATALLRASVEAAAGDAPVIIGGFPLPLDCLRTVGALEIAVHAWDISQACGQRLPIPEESATDLLAQAMLLVPPLGRYPMFAAPAPVAARSTSSDRLTAYLGRPPVSGDH